MPSFFSNKKLIVLLTSLVILIALISYSLRNEDHAAWPERFVQDTVGWFQYVINVPAQYAAGFFENVNDIRNAYDENKKLKADLEHYAQVEQDNRDLSQRYNEMKKLLKIDKTADLFAYKKYPAMVIGRSYDDWNQILTIDKGRLNGIRSGMPVVNAQGLIGKIGKIGNFTSQVTLITNTQDVNQISAKISSASTYGMINGYNQKRGTLTLQKIPIKAKLKKGQGVITSGLSGMYPERLSIGKILSISTDQYGLTKTAEIKPSVDFNNLNYVAVIQRKAASGDTGR
ncbi:MAG: rod shape-determining protein MreC [Sporolactobacillus sp.]